VTLHLARADVFDRTRAFENAYDPLDALAFLAEKLKVDVCLTNNPAKLAKGHNGCTGFSVSPMFFEGFICIQCRVVALRIQELGASDDQRFVSQLTHEIGHVVMGSFDEDEVHPWEVCAAVVLFGKGSAEVADVIQYAGEAGVSGPVMREAQIAEGIWSEEDEREWSEEDERETNSDNHVGTAEVD
jgi:hypothetical protein